MNPLKFLPFLIVPLLCAGCGEPGEPQIGDELVWSDYKKVSVSVDVEIEPDPSISPDISTYVGAAAFMMDFWFAPGGGDPMHQQASWRLTDYEHHASGNATKCTGTPAEEAWLERDLAVTGKLAPTPENEAVDHFTFHVSRLPEGESIMVTRVCGAGLPATAPDPAILIHLVLPLYQEQWETDIREDTTQTSVRRDVELSGMALADVTVTTSMRRVSSFEQ